MKIFRNLKQKFYKIIEKNYEFLRFKFKKKLIIMMFSFLNKTQIMNQNYLIKIKRDKPI
jgi:hypothetical protein